MRAHSPAVWEDTNLPFLCQNRFGLRCAEVVPGGRLHRFLDVLFRSAGRRDNNKSAGLLLRGDVDGPGADVRGRRDARQNHHGHSHTVRRGRRASCAANGRPGRQLQQPDADARPSVSGHEPRIPTGPVPRHRKEHAHDADVSHVLRSAVLPEQPNRLRCHYQDDRRRGEPGACAEKTVTPATPDRIGTEALKMMRNI